MCSVTWLTSAQWTPVKLVNNVRCSSSTRTPAPRAGSWSSLDSNTWIFSAYTAILLYFFFFTFYFLDFTCKWSNFSDFFLSKRKSPGEFKRKTSLFMFLWDLLLSLWIFSKEWNNFCFQKVYINQLKPWQCEQLLSSPCQYPHHSCLQPRVTVNCEQSKIIPSCKNLKTWKKWTY